jgi:hypothetical protein
MIARIQARAAPIIATGLFLLPSGGGEAASPG